MSNKFRGEVSPSVAGAFEENLNSLKTPPLVKGNRVYQTTRFSLRQSSFMFEESRRHGDVFQVNAMLRGKPVVTSHPDHVKSLFIAKPELAPSITGESPLRPIVGSGSTLTAIGARHMRQRKLVLPPFHGKAIAQYSQIIEDAAEREIKAWYNHREFQIAPRTQAITLDVIMEGIFGIHGRPSPETPEAKLRLAIKKLVRISTTPVAQIAELWNTGQTEPVGITKFAMGFLDRPTYEIIASRRQVDNLEERNDILSLLLQATDENGEYLTDKELRDELLTLVLAGHETTANQLAWTLERLTRSKEALSMLVDAVRTDTNSNETVEAVIHESMRSRPVIPVIGRRVAVNWQLGEYGVPADTAIAMSILLLHHRSDLYPDPKAFRPERFLGHRPGTYDWIPFGGGTRRCLGAALAMAEQKIVLKKIVEMCDISCVNQTPEKMLHRNVTMIPAEGAKILVDKL